MATVNVSVQCRIDKKLVEWALAAYRKHRKTYAKDVKRELARIWLWKGGDLCFEDHDVTLALVESEGSFFIEDANWDRYLEEWTSSCGYKIHAVWKGTKEDRESCYGTLVPIVVEVA